MINRNNGLFILLCLLLLTILPVNGQNSEEGKSAKVVISQVSLYDGISNHSQSRDYHEIREKQRGIAYYGNLLKFISICFPIYEKYKPPALCESHIGSIVDLLESGEAIANNYIGGKVIYKLPGGEIYIHADMDTDSDGSPRAKEIDKWGRLETSLTYPGEKGQEKYVDAENIPYFVLPAGFYKDLGIKPGDIGCILHQDKIEYAVFADVGPKDKIGEGSIKLVQLLGYDPFVDGKVKRGIPEDVIYIVFPGSGDGTPQTPEDINDKGKDLFEKLGGNP
jgi:hypothetical protein